MDRALLAIIEERSKNEIGQCFAKAETLRRILWHRHRIKVHVNSVRRRTRALAERGTIGHKWIHPNRYYYRKGKRWLWTTDGTQCNWLRSEAEKREARWRAKLEKRKQRQAAAQKRQRQAEDRREQDRARRRRRAPDRAAWVMRPSAEDRVEVVSNERIREDMAAVLGDIERRNDAPVISPLALTPEQKADKAREDLRRARALGFDVPSEHELEEQRLRRKPPD